jgi:chromosome condensin MukBEF ATPase and DNA-binding subunit MukB
MADLETVLADYRTGLDAELALLGDLEALATRQHGLPHPSDPDHLTALARERERILAALGALEAQVDPLRQRISGDLAAARALPGFAGIHERHRRAAEIVARITKLDEESLARLQQADADRRAAAHNLETGEATLAAYRRVLQQPQPSAGLFTQRG